jgi:hypothetical protein
MNVSKLLEDVKDIEILLVFARALAADRAASVEQEKQQPSSPYDSGTNDWENTTIESFL